MKFRKVIATITLGLALTLTAAAPAAFAGTTTPTTAPTPQQVYKAALAQYHIAMAARRARVAAIDATFATSVAAAKAHAAATLAADTTSIQRITTRDTLRSAIIEAVEVRSSSLAALPKAPVKPEAPTKPRGHQSS